MLFRCGRRADAELAVVALDVEGEGVEAADEGELVAWAAAVVEVDTVDGAVVSVEDMFAGVERSVETVAKEIRPVLGMIEREKRHDDDPADSQKVGLKWSSSVKRQTMGVVKRMDSCLGAELIASQKRRSSISRVEKKAKPATRQSSKTANTSTRDRAVFSFLGRVDGTSLG